MEKHTLEDNRALQVITNRVRDGSEPFGVVFTGPGVAEAYKGLEAMFMGMWSRQASLRYVLGYVEVGVTFF